MEEPKVLGILTASQIKTFDEVGRDKQGAEATLKVALQFHANRVNELAKIESELWYELAKAHGFEIGEGQFCTKHVNGTVCIVEVE